MLLAAQFIVLPSSSVEKITAKFQTICATKEIICLLKNSVITVSTIKFKMLYVKILTLDRYYVLV